MALRILQCWFFVRKIQVQKKGNYFKLNNFSISRLYNRTMTSIITPEAKQRVCRKCGIEKSVTEYYPKTVTCKECHRAYCKSRYHVHKRPCGFAKLPADLQEKVYMLKMAGETYETIAAETGLNKNTLQLWFRKNKGTAYLMMIEYFKNLSQRMEIEGIPEDASD